MVKAPEKFLEAYLSHEKGLTGKVGKRPLRIQIRKVTDAELARLKQNLQTIWDIYCTREIKQILSKKHNIRFLDLETPQISLNLSYVDKGILMEYEFDMGNKKDLAGARIYKQAETFLNRYFTYEKGVEELLKTSNIVLQALVDILIDKEIPETDIWNAIAKGEQIHLLPSL